MKRAELIELIASMVAEDVMDLDEVDQNGDGVLVRCEDGAIYQINVKTLRRGSEQEPPGEDTVEDEDPDFDDE